MSQQWFQTMTVFQDSYVQDKKPFCCMACLIMTKVLLLHSKLHTTCDQRRFLYYSTLTSFVHTLCCPHEIHCSLQHKQGFLTKISCEDK